MLDLIPWSRVVRMMKVLDLFLLLAAGVPTPQQTQVFKCMEQGQASYQSMPCDGAALKMWSVLPQASIEPGATAGVRKPVRAGRRAGHSGAGSGRSAQRPGGDACTKARQGRDAAYRAAGLKRGFALSSYWDNRVHDACR